MAALAAKAATSSMLMIGAPFFGLLVGLSALAAPLAAVPLAFTPPEEAVFAAAPLAALLASYLADDSAALALEALFAAFKEAEALTSCAGAFEADEAAAPLAALLALSLVEDADAALEAFFAALVSLPAA